MNEQRKKGDFNGIYVDLRIIIQCVYTNKKSVKEL